ncbi:g6f-like isoform X1 [Anguilla anguilla]|uniref:g6f-like isoform X1 n=2 Tax=Anguilla anguilla TaxID=7936 RepID=UPI0015AB4E06|nr:g6f-like isoform X1 [Anguilla anguilla]
MELFFLPCPLFIALLSVSGAASAKEDWDDVVVTKENTPVTLACSDRALTGSVKLEWLWKPDGRDAWSLVLSANQRQEFRGGASKADMRLADPHFQTSGDFSLRFKPRASDGGRYSCLVDLGEKKARQRVTLLAILRVAVGPALPVPADGTLRLVTEVSPSEAVSEVAWFSPRDLPLRSETLPSGAVVCKLPHFGRADQGNYTCQVRPRAGARRHHFLFTYGIAADVSKAANFTSLTNGTAVSTACLSRTPVPLSCTAVPGDYVLLYWQRPDRRDMDRVFAYDRWRRDRTDGTDRTVRTPSRLRLANPAAAKSGIFSFVLEPELQEGGVYLCEVFLNDHVFSHATRISVLRVYAQSTPSMLVLWCQYSERSQVKQVSWAHQNQSYRLTWSSSAPGRLTTEVPLPLRPGAAGNYTCALELRTGKVIRAVYTVTLPPAVNPSLSSPVILFPLSGLGLLVPLVAVALGVLLWKRGHRITRPRAEQSLSHHSGEVENVYENPEDLRQAPGQSSVYMDLKPTNDDDVYKELDRYEQCPC